MPNVSDLIAALVLIWSKRLNTAGKVREVALSMASWHANKIGKRTHKRKHLNGGVIFHTKEYPSLDITAVIPQGGVQGPTINYLPSSSTAYQTLYAYIQLD